MRFPFFSSKHTEDEGADLRVFFRFAKTPHLSPERKQQMRAVLLSEFSRVTQEQPERYNKRKTAFIIQFQPMIPIIAGIVIVIGALFGTAQFADAAKPGDVLYGVDRTAEDMHLFMTFNGAQKAKVKADIAAEREKERGELQDLGRTKDEKTAAEHVDNALNNALETVTEVQQKLEEKGNEHASEVLTNVTQRLEDIQQRHEEKTQQQNGNGNGGNGNNSNIQYRINTNGIDDDEDDDSSDDENVNDDEEEDDISNENESIDDGTGDDDSSDDENVNDDEEDDDSSNDNENQNTNDSDDESEVED